MRRPPASAARGIAKDAWLSSGNKAAALGLAGNHRRSPT